MERCVWLDDKREGKFGFLQKRVGSRDGIQCRPHVLQGAIRVGGWVEASLKAKKLAPSVVTRTHTRPDSQYVHPVEEQLEVAEGLALQH